MHLRSLPRAAGFGLTAAMLADPAAAHHVMDNQLPATLVEGLLSGIGHPIIGLDHLAGLVALGVLAARHERGGTLVIGFVLAMLGGAVAHVWEWRIPGAEILVALSLILLGVAAALEHATAAGARMLLVAAAGLVHGYALGESIVGAEQTPLLAYFAGLALVQTVLAYELMLGVRLLLRQAGGAVPRAAGVGVLLVGVAFLAI